MSLTDSGPRSDATSSPAVAQQLRLFEADWRSASDCRPGPELYLPSDPSQRRAALLALLRSDLVLRFSAREQLPLESYLTRFPELDSESQVALLYEEFSLREEAGESPTLAEYEARFPDLAHSFREVIEIHDLLGPVRGMASQGACRNGTVFPEAGQTIAGFRLVEELGRGAFARVFLAEEQHLADRPVALKVTRTGSREPQTLARLQHTHIVPVYSYRTDAATGLHLLCMPYLGRVTLLQILNHPELAAARSGADLLNLLDRLQPKDSALSERDPSCAALVRRTYAEAIAWWGARLAEAMQHAHDRQVLHRDVKPSNVLVGTDGLPMLLDFNLAQGAVLATSDEAHAGVRGTLAYMAPEQLESLADGLPIHVDARSDIYAFGVVLFECLVRGTRSFALPSKSLTMTEGLLRTAELRRTRAPRLRTTHRDVPAALEAVISRCLAPIPNDRYESAEQLAADLQAVADGAPLRFAREPISSRSVRWLLRNRRRLAVAAPVILALLAAAYSLWGAQLAAVRRDAEVRNRFAAGRRSAGAGQLELASDQFGMAVRLAEDDPRLRDLVAQINDEDRLARQNKEFRDRADELLSNGERLRFSLLGFSDDSRAACRDVERALAKFSVLDDPNWIGQPRVQMLDHDRRARLIAAIDELLFLWVVALDVEPRRAQESLRICDAALRFASPLGPWRAIRRRCASKLAGETPPPSAIASPEAEQSARDCFKWALLCDREGKTESVVEWLLRATQLEPQDYWSHFYLGDFCERIGQHARAMSHYEAAVALRPHSPWARCNRALLRHNQGEWDLALDDLNKALKSPQGADLLEARLVLGLVNQVKGDDAGARSAYDAVIAAGPDNPFASAARLNRAKLDIDAGAVDQAWAEYEALLAVNPRDVEVRLSRALLALRLGRAALAEADLTMLLEQVPERAAEVLATRARARLVLGQLENAEADAAGAYRRNPSPSRERLWVRTLLALRRIDDLLWISRPDDLTVLPGGGQALTVDLREAEKKLKARAAANRSQQSASSFHRTRAVILSALNDPAALAEASHAIKLIPNSPDAYIVCARVRRRTGNLQAALTDVASALELVPGDPRLLELRGVLKTETGNPTAALVDFDRAILRGASTSVRMPRALALMAAGKNDAAVRDWSLALDEDAESAEAYLGRATALIRLGRADRALVDLDQAADWATGGPILLGKITASYAVCLAARPDRFTRWLRLARRTWSAWTDAARTSKSAATLRVVTPG
jgi:eukaryotic-like serine/threonine-protein kinase